MSQSSPSDTDTSTEDIAPEDLDTAAQSDSATAGSSAQEVSSSAEDTGEAGSFQGKEEGAGESSPASGAKQAAALDPRGLPWVDFVPEFTHRRPETLGPCLGEHLANLNDHMRDKELLKLSSHSQAIHEAYLGLWVRSCNRLFRCLVKVKRRRQFYQDRAQGKPSKEGVA